jgi:enoyl-CoA hydratase/carnithine racemase
VSEGAELLFERVDRQVAVLTINRPAARNAVNGAVTRALSQAVSRVEQDPDLLVAVLTGAGDRAFCAGADLRTVAAGKEAELETSEGGFAGFVRVPRKKVWIAAVQGSALGGGLELMLACDLAVVADTALLGLPEVSRGMVAGGGGVIRLPRVLPRAVALGMVLTGRPLTAVAAAAFGLVNAVVPAAEVRTTALELAAAICENSPFAVREGLALAKRAHSSHEAELWEANGELQRRLVLNPDYAEGPAAFVSKRSPRWRDE